MLSVAKVRLLLPAALMLTLLLGIGVTTLTVPLAVAAPTISQVSDPSGDVSDPHGYVDVVEAKILQTNPTCLQFEMKLRSTVPIGPTSAVVTYLWLVDTDQNINTGQRHIFVGSEYNIRVALYQGRWQGYIDAINPPYIGGRTPVFLDGNTVTTLLTTPQIGGAQQFNWEIGTFDDAAADSANSYAVAQVSSTPPGPGVISDVSLSPPYLALSDGVTKAWMFAIARDMGGNSIPFSSIDFFADNPSAVSVSGTGEVQAAVQKFGYCWVTAKIDGILSSNHVDIRVGSIRLLPPILLLSVADNPTGSLALQIRDAAGSDVSPSTTHFLSSNPSVATVSNDGLVTAIMPPADFSSTPYITAEADRIPANNAAIVRVTHTTLGLSLDAFAAKHLTFYVPQQPINGFDYEQIFSAWDVVRITDIAYELEHEATGIYPFQGDMQFLANDPGHGGDGTVPCGVSGNPVRLGTDVDKPVHNSCMIVAYDSGTPQWGVFFHEIGHNFLGEGTKTSQFMSGHSSDFVYAEGLATALGMYAAKMLKERSLSYGIPQAILNNIQSSVWHFGSTPDLDAYVGGGASYSQMTPSVLDDMIDVILSKYGYSALYGFFSVFLPRDAPYSFQLMSDTDQATLFVAALGSSVGADLRNEFRQWGFPIDDSYYSAIWNEVDQLVNQRYPRLSSVVRGIDGRVYHGADVLAPWLGWTAVQGSTPDSPAACTCGPRLHLAVRGNGNGIYYGYVTLSTKIFSGWSRLSGSTSSPPALAAGSDCTLYLLVRGSDDGIYLRTLPNGGSWSGWQKLPGKTVDGPTVAVVESVLHVAVRGSDGSSIWHGRMDRASGNWLGWSRVSGSTPSKPSLAAASATEVYLAVRGMNNRVYVNRWESGTWIGWSQIPTGNTPSGPSILAMNDQLYVAVRGTDSRIYWCSRALPSGSWSSWSKLPGSTPSSPALA